MHISRDGRVQADWSVVRCQRPSSFPRVRKLIQNCLHLTVRQFCAGGILRVQQAAAYMLSMLCSFRPVNSEIVFAGFILQLSTS